MEQVRSLQRTFGCGLRKGSSSSRPEPPSSDSSPSDMVSVSERYDDLNACLGAVGRGSTCDAKACQLTGRTWDVMGCFMLAGRVSNVHDTKLRRSDGGICAANARVRLMQQLHATSTSSHPQGSFRISGVQVALSA